MTLSNPIKIIALTTVFFFLLSSCSVENSNSNASNSVESDCLYNAPVAIFETVKDSLTNYQFEKLGPNKTLESFLLKNEQIEIIQNGCNEISQEFRFQTNSEKSIVDFATDIFNSFSALDPSLFVLNQFATEFQNQKELIKTGQKVQFSDIIYLKMDETPIGESRMIRILMTSEKN